MSSRSRTPAIIVLLVLFGASADAHAFVAEGQVGGVNYRVMAPDWICGGENVSLLIVATAVEDAGSGVPLRIVMTPPADGFDGGGDPVLESTVQVEPGATHRLAFKSWKAMPLDAMGSGTFVLRFSSPSSSPATGLDAEATVEIPVRIIRGAAVPRGLWSLVVPALIALLAVPVFMLFQRFYAQRGAWKEAVDLHVVADGEESWWKSEN